MFNKVFLYRWRIHCCFVLLRYFDENYKENSFFNQNIEECNVKPPKILNSNLIYLNTDFITNPRHALTYTCTVKKVNTKTIDGCESYISFQANEMFSMSWAQVIVFVLTLKPKYRGYYGFVPNM